MPKTNDLSVSKPVWIGILLAALAGVAALSFLLQRHAPGNMGWGLLAGGGGAILALGIAMWRLAHHPERATTLERAWTQHGDERDDAVLTRALAVVGLAAPLVAAAATIALALGGPLLPTLAALNFAFIAIFAVAFTWLNRRS